jgi:hypothetical protein
VLHQLSVIVTTSVQLIVLDESIDFINANQPGWRCAGPPGQFLVAAP